ncbi:MAG: succinylglutamate desuccinylase/aspartoacylase family protein, partial [SAR324 cluster bacterium]|nr:succinylglutamate desuccinylase/aspartoacylase family protein [SAR324 cluster bacterium]
MTHLEYRKLEDLPTKAVADFILPWSMPGAEMKIRHFRYGIPGSRPRVYLQASLHADEIPGMLVLHHLMRLLDTADRARHIRGEIIIVPAANPMGLSQWTFGTQQGRFESKSGINFNRDYPCLSEALVETVKDQLNDEASENRELIRQSALTELGKIQPKTPA